MLDGKTIGRHYAGPNWQQPGRQRGGCQGRRQCASRRASKDIPWLKLEVTSRRGSGVLSRRHHGAAHQHRRAA